MHSGVFWNCLAWKCQVIGFLFTPEIKTWCVRCKIWQHLNCIEGYYAWRYYLCLYVSNWIVCKMAGTGFELAAATANPALQKWRVHTCTVALGAVSTAVIWTCVCTSCGHLWEEWNCFRVKKFSFSGQHCGNRLLATALQRAQKKSIHLHWVYVCLVPPPQWSPWLFSCWKFPVNLNDGKLKTAPCKKQDRETVGDEEGHPL